MTARWSPKGEIAAWGRAVRGAVLILVALAAVLLVLRVAGVRGLFVASLVGGLVFWLGRLGRPRA